MAEFFYPTDGRTDRETDMTKLMVFLRNFAIAAKNAISESDSIASDCRVIIKKLSFKKHGEKRSWRDSKNSSKNVLNGLGEVTKN